MTSSYDFYTCAGYYKELAACARTATKGNQISIITASFAPEDSGVIELLDELATAAKRGADISLVIDSYRLIINESGIFGPLFFGKNIQNATHGSFRKIRETLEQLEQSGVSTHIINIPKRPFINPFSGRSHIKFAVVNNRVFIGGCNLNHPEYLDVMMAWNDESIANQLRSFITKITETKSATLALDNSDLSIPISGSLELLFDAGIKKQSLILDEACKLIDESKEYIVITCQYFPGGRIAKHLKTAHKRGVKILVYFSAPRTHGLIAMPGQWLYTQREKTRLPRRFFRNKLKSRNLLHAKLLATDKGFMLGSHNYVDPGVQFGTAEMTLKSSSKTIGKKLIAFMEEQFN